MALREDQVLRAVNFLRHPKTADQTRESKEAFLARKGATAEEIAEALKRCGYDNPSSDASGAAPLAAASAPQQQPLPTPATQQVLEPTVANGMGASSWQYASSYGPPPYNLPAQLQYAAAAYGGVAPSGAQSHADNSWPWWGWLAGGAAAGLGVAGLALGPTASPLPAARFQQQQGSMPPSFMAGSPTSVQQSLSEAPTTARNVPSKGESSEGHAVEELIALIRQQSEEARENAAVFAKALETQQEQYQQLFEDMHKFMQAHVQQQKPTNKPQPTELSAGTLQTLASLLREAGPVAGSSAEATSQERTLNSSAPLCTSAATVVGTGGAASSTPAVTAALPDAAAATPTGAPQVDGSADDLGSNFAAIGRALQRLTWECASKGEVSKSLKTLSILIQKLVSNPTQAQHRKVNASGSRFRDLLGGNTPGAELMHLAGFQYQAPNFIMSPEQSLEAAQHVLDLMQEHEHQLDQVWASRSPPPDVSATGGASLAEAAAGASAESSEEPSRSPLAEAGATGEASLTEAVTGTSAERPEEPKSGG